MHLSPYYRQTCGVPSCVIRNNPPNKTTNQLPVTKHLFEDLIREYLKTRVCGLLTPVTESTCALETLPKLEDYQPGETKYPFGHYLYDFGDWFDREQSVSTTVSSTAPTDSPAASSSVKAYQTKKISTTLTSPTPSAETT